MLCVPWNYRCWPYIAFIGIMTSFVTSLPVHPDLLPYKAISTIWKFPAIFGQFKDQKDHVITSLHSSLLKTWRPTMLKSQRSNQLRINAETGNIPQRCFQKLLTVTSWYHPVMLRKLGDVCCLRVTFLTKLMNHFASFSTNTRQHFLLVVRTLVILNSLLWT